MFSIIVAIDKENGIGYKNNLLYKISADLKRFKILTMNHTIVMGSNTYKSLSRVLPGRNHIVLSTTESFEKDNNGFIIKTENNINNLLKKYKDSKEEVFIIGGASIYKLLLPYTNKLYLTKIMKKADKVDSYFPEIDYSLYNECFKSEIFEEKNGVKYQFIDLVRKEG